MDIFTGIGIEGQRFILSSMHRLAKMNSSVYIDQTANTALHDTKVTQVLGVWSMAYGLSKKLHLRFSRPAGLALLTLMMLGSTQVSLASPTVDQLSQCLVKSTTAADKTAVLQSTFSALAAHPDLKQYSNVSDAQKTQLDKNLAQVMQRILVEQCSNANAGRD